jgi:NAD(P)-dependent dehydrogenase (short-subunit alcohol dehydrogenase family)
MPQQFTNRKLVVIDGSSGIGRRVAVIAGHRQDEVEQTVAELSATGTAWGIAADLRDLAELVKVQAQLASEHVDATLLVNAADVFKPLPLLEHTAADYDSYLELNRAMFSLTQTAARGWSPGRGGAIVNIGSMWAQQAIAATPSSAYSMAKAGLHACAGSGLHLDERTSHASYGSRSRSCADDPRGQIAAPARLARQRPDPCRAPGGAAQPAPAADRQRPPPG